MNHQNKTTNGKEKCEMIQESFAEVLYDEADSVTTEAVQNHLESCEACRFAFNEMKSASWLLQDAIETLPEMRLTETEKQDLLARTGYQDRSRFFIVRRFILSAAAVLVVTCLLGIYLAHEPEDESISLSRSADTEFASVETEQDQEGFIARQMEPAPKEDSFAEKTIAPSPTLRAFSARAPETGNVQKNRPKEKKHSRSVPEPVLDQAYSLDLGEEEKPIKEELSFSAADAPSFALQDSTYTASLSSTDMMTFFYEVHVNDVLNADRITAPELIDMQEILDAFIHLDNGSEYVTFAKSPFHENSIVLLIRIDNFRVNLHLNEGCRLIGGRKDSTVVSGFGTRTAIFEIQSEETENRWGTLVLSATEAESGIIDKKVVELNTKADFYRQDISTDPYLAFMASVVEYAAVLKDRRDIQERLSIVHRIAEEAARKLPDDPKKDEFLKVVAKVQKILLGPARK